MYNEIKSALISSACISPIMTIIDMSVIQSQIKHISFGKSLITTQKNIYNRTLPFFRPLYTMNFVYSATYITANCSNYLVKNNYIDSKFIVYNGKYIVLFSTSLVNIASIAYKDIQYSKLFHNQNQQKVNLKGNHFNSYSLFAIRDMMTISSAFILKQDMNDYLENKYNITHRQADFISSMTLPIITQCFSTPIHILSIDYLQKPEITFSQRLQHIKNIYWSVCIGRMIRVIPAFCMGGFLNDLLLNK
jgi:hypothetical protein